MKYADIPKITEDQEHNFWSKVSPTGFCWLWTASVCRSGYGNFNVGRMGRKFKSHRIAYTLLVGKIPDGLELDHLCRVRRCVNPDHLEPVTPEENRKRSQRVNNGNYIRAISAGQRTHCSKGHEYTEITTYRYKDGRKDCLICKKANRLKYKLRLQASVT